MTSQLSLRHRVAANPFTPRPHATRRRRGAACAWILAACASLATPAFGETLVWQDAFEVEVPAGWEHWEHTFDLPPPSHVVLLRSPNALIVSVGMIEGEHIVKGLEQNTLAELSSSYLEAYFKALHLEVVGKDPWGCTLRVPESSALRGYRLKLASGEVTAEAYTCTTRLDSGRILVAMAWIGSAPGAPDETAAQKVTPTQLPEVALEVMRGVGLRAVHGP